LGLTLMVTIWTMVTSDSASSSEEGGMETVTRFFISKAMAFFVGCVFVVVVRQLIAPLSLLAETFFVRYELPAQASDAIVVLLFCPLLTMLLFWAEQKFLVSIVDAAGGDHTQKQARRMSMEQARRLSTHAHSKLEGEISTLGLEHTHEAARARSKRRSAPPAIVARRGGLGAGPGQASEMV
jgi:hypothetical protein